MNNTLPFSAIKKTLKEIDNYKSEIRNMKKTNARQTNVFISVANKLEQDLRREKEREMVEFQQEFDWLITNVLEQEKMKEKEMNRKWQEKETLYNKEYVKLYNRMHTEALLSRDTIKKLEIKLSYYLNTDAHNK
jgi:hypothetical protein